MSDFIDALEQELRAASQRRMRLAAARLPRPRARAATTVTSLRAIPVLLAALVAVGVAVVVLTEVRHNPKRSTAGTAMSGRQQLIDILAVLRRPQTNTDRAYPKNITSSGPVMALGGGAPDISLIRYVTTTPWGERLFFVPLKPPTAREIAASVNQFPRRLRGQARRDMTRQARRGETLGVFSSSGGGGSATAADIKAGNSFGTEGAGRSFAGGSTKTRLILVVPDGVAKVVFVFGRQPAGALYGAPVYKHSLRVTAPVHDNVAAVQVDRQVRGSRPTMIWYATNGRVVKRIGSFAPSNRVIAPPQPGPATPLSRAAERDPSTPNHVWVSPTSGGPHTTFTIHFRVLLNGADYNYRFTGTRCPGFTFPGGTGNPNALRGDLWSDPISAATGQTLCPGTYHVGVSVMDFGRFRGFRRPAQPFGTTTFTVR